MKSQIGGPIDLTKIVDTSLPPHLVPNFMSRRLTPRQFLEVILVAIVFILLMFLGSPSVYHEHVGPLSLSCPDQVKGLAGPDGDCR